MTTPKISAIISSYNHAPFIGQAIASVLDQTYPQFELIVVDDGSTDNSRQIIESYDDARIQRIFQANGGQGAAFNAGYAIASGDIVVFLDSDDWWKPEKLATVVKWDQFLEGDYGLLQHGLTVWRDGHQTPYKHILPVGDCWGQMQQTGQIDFFVPTTGLCFRKSTLDRIFPIPKQLRICADAYLMRTAFLWGKVYSIPDSLGYYRQHQNSVYNNQNFRHSEYFQSVLFPALNQFYQQQGSDYKVSWERVIGGTPSQKLHRRWRKFLNSLQQKQSN